MDQIIDVEYREIKELTDKTTEQLAAEANALWAQMETIGNIGMMMAAQAGQRLQVVKGRLQHGQWEAWVKNNLSFSVRKANRMMALAEKMTDENSIFSNPTTLSGIGISKIWALLGAPEDVAEEAVKNPKAPEMSVKEFQEEIRRLKAEIARQPEVDPAALQAKEAELQKLQDKLAKEKERSKKLKDSVDAEREKAAADAKIKAEKEAQEKFEQETKLLQESNQEAAAEIDRLTRKLANSANADMATFKAYADQLQKAFGSCMTAISKVETQDEPQAAKMRDALRSVMENLVESI